LVKAVSEEHQTRGEKKNGGRRGSTVESRNKGEVKGVGGRGTEGEVGDKEGVVVKDGECGKECVRDVKGGRDEKDLEIGGGGGDDVDGVFEVKVGITVFVMYSKARVGPWRESGVRSKSIKRGK